MKNEEIISNDNDYQETMMIIYNLMNKGEANLTGAELQKLQLMALAVEKYEDEVLNFK